MYLVINIIAYVDIYFRLSRINSVCIYSLVYFFFTFVLLNRGFKRVSKHVF